MKQSARIIRNNVPYTLLNGVAYGEPVHVSTVDAARALKDPPPPAIAIGSAGASVTGVYYWDSANTDPDDGQTRIKLTSVATGRYKPVSIISGGAGGGLAVANIAGLKAVLSTSLTDTQPSTVQSPGSNWVWSAHTGAGFPSDDVTVVKPDNVALESNGRWYNTAPTPAVATIAALRSAVSGQHNRITIQAHATAGDGGGGTFVKRTGQPARKVSGVTRVSGFFPPPLHLRGTPAGDYNIQIEIQNNVGDDPEDPALLSSGDVRFRWSINGGSTWEAQNVTASTEQDLGATGLRLYMLPGKYTTSSVYTAAVYRDDGGSAIVPTGVTTFYYERETRGTINVCHFGADPTGVADSWDVVHKAIRAGRRVFFPPGTYTFSDTLAVGEAVELFGGGPNAVFAPGAYLVFPVGKAGIVLVHGGLSGGTDLHDLTIAGNGSTVTPPNGVPQGWERWAPNTAYTAGETVVPQGWTGFGWALRARNNGTSGATQPSDWHAWGAWPVPSESINPPYVDNTVTWDLVEDANGLTIKSALVSAERLYVRNFSGNGISFLADNAEGSFANVTKLDKIFVTSNAGHGLFGAGTDSNAGKFGTINAIGNGGWGIHDASLIENAYDAIHTQDNQGGASVVIHGTVTHHYAEPGQGPSRISGVSLGGNGEGQGGLDGLAHSYRKVWAAGETIVAGDIRRPTIPNGWYYRALDAGTTHATTEPTWANARGKGLTVIDNAGGSQITWQCYGVYWPGDGGPTSFGSTEVCNATVRNAGNPDNVQVLLGQFAGQNAPVGWHYVAPNGLPRDSWVLHYHEPGWTWRMLNGFAVEIWGTFDRGNPRSLDHRMMYYPWGIWLGRNYGDNTIGSGAGDYGVRFTSGNSAPSTGLWFKGNIHWHADTAAGEPTGWVCKSAGGWSDTTRANSTAVALRAIIEPTAGHVWECTTAGTTAGSPPAFVAGNDYTDGTVFWTYRGVEPPLFEAIYSAPLTAQARVLKGMPAVTDTDVDIDEFGRITVGVTTGTVIKIPVEVPSGATLTGLTMRVIGGGNAALPAVMPRFTFRVLTLAGNTTAGNGPQVDASVNVAAYNAEHTIAMTGLSEAINNETKRYIVEFVSESGADSSSGFVIVGTTATFTPAAPDRGAA
jgi:hypothetical protein